MKKFNDENLPIYGTQLHIIYIYVHTYANLGVCPTFLPVFLSINATNF